MVVLGGISAVAFLFVKSQQIIIQSWKQQRRSRRIQLSGLCKQTISINFPRIKIETLLFS